MADFGINASFDHSAAALRPAPKPPTPAVPAIEAGGTAGGPSGRMADDGRAGGFAPDAALHQALLRDKDPLAGPPPSFQANVLELERDLRNAIARIEAARGKSERDEATRPPEAPQPSAVSDAAGATSGTNEAVPSEALATRE